MAVVLAATVWVYWPALDGGFLWDDAEQFAAVPAVQSPSGWWRVWYPISAAPRFDTPQFYPLSFSVFWAMYQVFGEWTPVYHWLNLLLHLGNTALLLAIFRRFEPRWAIFGAAFFALHPVLVPAVAWMCQLRNLLSLHLALWATWFWIDDEIQRQRRTYCLALGSFMLAMLAKTAVAPLPLVLYVAYTAYQPRRGRARELAPMLAISLVLGIVTVVYERSTGAAGETFAASWGERVARIGWLGWFHLRQALFPFGTSFVYPRWSIDPERWTTYLPTALGALALAAAIAWDLRRRTGLAVCLVCYLLLLSPVLGLFNVYFMQYAWVADHWQYPALPALAAAIVLALRQLAETRWLRPAVGIVVAALAVNAWLAHGRAALFDNQRLLWEDTLAKNPGGWLPNNNFGYLLEHDGELAEAHEHYQRALATEPGNAKTLFNLARLYRRLGDYASAEAALREAIDKHPEAVAARLSMTALLIEQQRFAAAVEAARAILQREPNHAGAHYNLGVALAALGQPGEAAKNFAAAVDAEPDFIEARRRLASVCLTSGRLDEAIEHFRAWAALAPDDGMARFGLASALDAADQPAAAVDAYRDALRLRPQWPEAANNLAAILATSTDPALRDPADAVRLAERACAATGYQHAGMLATLMAAYAAAERYEDAAQVAQRAIEVAQAAGDGALVDQLRAQAAAYRQRHDSPDD